LKLLPAGQNELRQQQVGGVREERLLGVVMAASLGNGNDTLVPLVFF
jgi:hypothetical protein